MRGKSRTIALRRPGTTSELRRGLALYPVEPHGRPTNRRDCAGHKHQCPFVSCRYHLYLDVNARNGSIKLNFPDTEVWEMADSCALDVADRGGSTMDEVAAVLNVTRQAVEQLQTRAVARLQRQRPEVLARMDPKT